MDYRRALNDLEQLSDEKYLELKSTEPEQLTLREIVMVSFLKQSLG